MNFETTMDAMSVVETFYVGFFLHFAERMSKFKENENESERNELRK